VSALVNAVWADDAARVARVLARGADPDAPDADGTTPLYAAAVGGRAGLVRQLLAAGADPNRLSTGPSDGSPLCGAACWGYVETVDLLLAHGADPDLPEDERSTPLDWAARGMHADVALSLLAAGAQPTGEALRTAIERGSLATVRALLDHGAVPDAGALELARSWASKDLVAELRRQAGERAEIRHDPPRVEATVQRENGRGVLVRETGHAEIAALLEDRLT
jgi:ankyrin repeat protein